jgi:hypothetical protein
MSGEHSVQCGVHGVQPETFVCQHIFASLTTQQPVGFHWPESDPSERPDAWCSACNDLLSHNGWEWTPEASAHAGIKLICGRCYDRARAICFGPTQ